MLKFDVNNWEFMRLFHTFGFLRTRGRRKWSHDRRKGSCRNWCLRDRRSKNSYSISSQLEGIHVQDIKSAKTLGAWWKREWGDKLKNLRPVSKLFWCNSLLFIIFATVVDVAPARIYNLCLQVLVVKMALAQKILDSRWICHFLWHVTHTPTGCAISFCYQLHAKCVT